MRLIAVATKVIVAIGMATIILIYGYLFANKDVKYAINKGTFASGFEH